MKRFASYILYTLLLSAIACACSDNLDIHQSYGYSVETLPLPKSLKNGETVALEFSIVREGYYSETSYKFRYFQSEGAGILTYKAKVIPMNRFQDIASDDFVLIYQCVGEEQQQLDFVFEDSFGRRVEYIIEFASGRTEE
ncbi:hypothetical protein Barb7_00860 [Bacteroidales bacterium Barb7]|nr:hypothetical protein Barb7_00860 [Bacteroidales bacterium Barb7]